MLAATAALGKDWSRAGMYKEYFQQVPSIAMVGSSDKTEVEIELRKDILTRLLDYVRILGERPYNTKRHFRLVETPYASFAFLLTSISS